MSSDSHRRMPAPAQHEADVGAGWVALRTSSPENIRMPVASGLQWIFPATRTTIGYTHVLNEGPLGVRSPLDRLVPAGRTDAEFLPPRSRDGSLARGGPALPRGASQANADEGRERDRTT